MINISNYTCNDNPQWVGSYARPGRYGGRAGLVLAVGVALDWLAYFLRRWGDRRFSVTDAEAYWWRWQITKTLGGLGRRYRDIRFDTWTK